MPEVFIFLNASVLNKKGAADGPRLNLSIFPG